MLTATLILILTTPPTPLSPGPRPSDAHECTPADLSVISSSNWSHGLNFESAWGGKSWISFIPCRLQLVNKTVYFSCRTVSKI